MIDTAGSRAQAQEPARESHLAALEKRMNEMADLLQNLAARVTILEMERKLDQSRDQRTRSGTLSSTVGMDTASLRPPPAAAAVTTTPSSYNNRYGGSSSSSSAALSSRPPAVVVQRTTAPAATSPSATAASSSRPPASRALFSYGNQHVHGSTLYNKGEIPMSKSTVDETPLDDKFLADARYDYSEFSGAGAAAAAPPSKLSGVMNTTTSSASPVEVVGGVAIPSAEETQKLIASLTAKFRDTQTLLDKARGQGLAR